MQNSRIVIDVGGRFILLHPTPENFQVASVLATEPLFHSNGEWDEKKLTYHARDNNRLNIIVKSVNIVSAIDDLVCEKQVADSLRFKETRKAEDLAKRLADEEKAVESLYFEVAKLQGQLAALQPKKGE
jgi:hypothetical protein